MGALIYVRCSTQEQAEHGVTIANQTERLRAYCDGRGLRIVGVIADEGVSAGTRLDTRPGGAELLRRVAAGEADHVVVMKLDRMWRNVADCLRTVEAWERQKVSLHITDMMGGAVDTGTAVGRFTFVTFANVAELERGLIRQRTREALTYKREHGQVYGPVPLGYDRNGSDLVPNLEELATVATIRRLRAEGLSLRAIGARLEAAGVTTKTGGTRWHARTVNYIANNVLYEQVAT